MILAAIDIGTNTLRLLIAEASSGVIREIHSDRKITRLGQHLDVTGRLSPDALDRSLTALSEFSKNIARHKTEHVAAAGTSALRNASNTSEFTAAVSRTTGIEIRVISGEEEARLTMLGVTHALNVQGGPALVIDIGGGSTELICADSAGRIREISVPLGAVYLTERFLKHDPPAAFELEHLRQLIRIELQKYSWLQRAFAGTALIGTAGTVTTLAAMDMNLPNYDPVRINGAALFRESIDRLVNILGRSAIKERRTLPGLEQGREDIILAGAVVCQEIMDRFGFKQMLVSDGGLREGILFDLYDTIQKRKRAPFTFRSALHATGATETHDE